MSKSSKIVCASMVVVFSMSAGAAERPPPQRLPDLPERMEKGFDLYPKRVVDAMSTKRSRDAAEAARKAATDAARGEFPSIAPEELRWRFVTTVTVAFNGGNESAYRLIEKAAREWTGHVPHFNLSFRAPDGRFRHWSDKDAPERPVADVRISFDGSGYWSLVGTQAKSTVPGNEATMNLGDIATVAAAYASPDREAAWLKTYAHSVVLHELGHVFGLAHEHFQASCQNDMKLKFDAGYSQTFDSKGQFIPDAAKRSPGIFLWYQGYPYSTVDQNQLRKNITLAGYVASFEDPAELRWISSGMDGQSVMLYWYPEYLFVSGSESPCKNLGDGKTGQTVYATHLSRHDVEAFVGFYGKI